MSIHSDVDLLFLYRDPLTPYVASVAERVQHWLWDAGLTVGCATRTIEETVELAREDVDRADRRPRRRASWCGERRVLPRFADRIRCELSSPTGGFTREPAGERMRRAPQALRRLALPAAAEPEGGRGRAARLSRRLLGRCAATQPSARGRRGSAASRAAHRAGAARVPRGARLPLACAQRAAPARGTRATTR